jgi:hypothetical protein
MTYRFFLASLVAAMISTGGFAAIAAETKPSDTKKSAPSPSSPEDVVNVYLGHLRGGHYDDVAKSMDPDACVRLRSMLLPVVKEAHKSNPEAGLLKMFDGIETTEGLEKLTPPQFVASFFGGLSKINPIFRDALASTTATIIGSVPEGPDVLHVVCRISTNNAGLTLTKMGVISIKKTNSKWGVMLSAEIENMADQIRRMLSGNVK